MGRESHNNSTIILGGNKNADCKKRKTIFKLRRRIAMPQLYTPPSPEFSPLYASLKQHIHFMQDIPSINDNSALPGCVVTDHPDE